MKKTVSFAEYKAEAFRKDPELEAEYEALRPMYEAISAEIAARTEAGLTQKQLAEKMGTAQANISRFERGSANPSIGFLQRMAASMGKTLKISFE